MITQQRPQTVSEPFISGTQNRFSHLTHSSLHVHLKGIHCVPDIFSSVGFYTRCKMKLLTVVSLLAVSFLVLNEGSNAAENGLAAAEEITAPEFISSDEFEEGEEAEPHVRVERSPGWGRRRRRWRVRIRNPVRKIGRAVRKAAKKVGQGVRKVGKGIKKVASKAKSGVKRLAAKTKAAIKKAGSKLKGAAKKAKDKAKSAIKKLKSHAKKVAKAPGNLAKKVRDKLMSLVVKKGGEEEEEVITDPTDPIVPPIPTDPVPTKPICNAACQFLKNATKEAIFFKQSFCVFYMVRRKHSDFMLDRNFNTTLAYMLTEIRKASFNFYSILAEVLQAEDSKIVLESRQKVSSDCAKGKLLKCNTDEINLSLQKLMCLRPCSGFQGCSQSDATLRKAIDKAIEAYEKAANRIIKLLT